jgi:hypothetical protein
MLNSSEAGTLKDIKKMTTAETLTFAVQENA